MSLLHYTISFVNLNPGLKSANSRVTHAVKLLITLIFHLSVEHRSAAHE